MGSILYLETNYLIGYAKGQETPVGIRLMESDLWPFRVAVPGICIMEALSTYNAEEKSRKKFADDLNYHLRETTRDRTSSYARSLLPLLQQARIDSGQLLKHIRNRLDICIHVLSHQCEIIPLDPRVIQRRYWGDLLDDPTDDLILHCILWHSENQEPGSRAFYTGNSKDFGRGAAKEALDKAGIRHFSTADNAVGWLKSQEAS